MSAESPRARQSRYHQGLGQAEAFATREDLGRGLRHKAWAFQDPLSGHLEVAASP